jgi:hypothetical protein
MDGGTKDVAEDVGEADDDPGTGGTGGSGGSTGGSGGSTGGSGGSTGGSGGNTGGSGGNTGGSGGNTGGSGGNTGGSGGNTGGSGGNTGGSGGSSNVPSSWYCDDLYYNEGQYDACDCGCGAADPDCGGAGCIDASCDAPACDFCFNASGVEISCGSTGGSGGGTGWTCDPTFYDGYDGCDCGCGIPDPDCGWGSCETPGCYVTGCEYCWDANGSEIQCGGGSAGCTNTCNFAYDGECDDGGPGSSYDDCDYGTDCADCGPR